MSELPLNRFRQGLASGTTQFGLWLGLPDNSVAEMLAGAGFDWLLIDHEHGPFELRDVMHHLQSIAPYPAAAIVRPADDSPALLKKLCDIGVQSFLVPMIDTAQQAAAVVENLKYAPQGKRGLGTSMARAARWNTVPDYLHKANDEICIIVQAETVTAMDNLDAIANVEGIDGVFIGPSDLSASMGHIGNAAHPDVVTAISNGLRTVRKAGRHAGLLCLDETQVTDYVEAGANFVGVGVDSLLLGNEARRLAARYVSGSGKPQQSGY